MSTSKILPNIGRRNLILGLSLTTTYSSLAALVLGGGTLGCEAIKVADQRRELLRSWGVDFLLFRYGLVIEGTEEILQKSLLLEEEVNEDTLKAVRAAYRSARRPWKETEIFKFGPVTDEPLRFGPKIDYWPTRPEDIESVLGGGDEIVPEELGAASRGFSAIEYLLFGPRSLASFREDPRRHLYLRAAAKDLKEQVEALRDAWDPDAGNFLGELVDAGEGSEMYDTLSMALSEIVNRMAFTVENIRADKLEAAIAPDGTPQPNKIESLYSGRSVADIKDNLSGIEAMFFGNEGQGLLGLDAYLQHRGYFLGQRLKQELSRAREALLLVDLPLSVAIEEAQTSVFSASETLAGLQRLIQVDIIGALSLSVRFNDNDGD